MGGARWNGGRQSQSLAAGAARVARRTAGASSLSRDFAGSRMARTAPFLIASVSSFFGKLSGLFALSPYIICTMLLALISI